MKKKLHEFCISNLWHERFCQNLVMQKLLISSTYYMVRYIIFEFIDLNQFISLLPHYRRTPLPSIVPVSYVAETVAQKCLKYLDEILQHVPDIAIFPIKRSNHYKIALSQFPKAPMGTKATPHSNSISVCNVRIQILS